MENLWKLFFVLILIVTIQSGHKYAHAATAQLHICDLNWLLFYMQEDRYFLQTLDEQLINPWKWVPHSSSHENKVHQCRHYEILLIGYKTVIKTYKQHH